MSSTLLAWVIGLLCLIYAPSSRAADDGTDEPTEETCATGSNCSPNAEDTSSKGDAEETSDGEANASQETSEDEADAKDDGQMTEAERQRWKERKRKARVIAMADAAGPDGWIVQQWTWDLNLEIGLTRGRGHTGSRGTVRTGLTRISEPAAYSLGVTGELGNRSTPAMGLELEALSLHLALFAQVAGLIDFRGRPTWSVSAGWQIFGVELQYEPVPEYGRSPWLGIFKLRLPVSWFVRGVTSG